MSDLWMITWQAMVNNRDRPREGARGAQRTHRGGPEGAYKGAPASTHRGGPEGAYRGDPATCRCCDLKIVYWFIDKTGDITLTTIHLVMWTCSLPFSLSPSSYFKINGHLRKGDPARIERSLQIFFFAR